MVVVVMLVVVVVAIVAVIVVSMMMMMMMAPSIDLSGKATINIMLMLDQLLGQHLLSFQSQLFVVFKF